jgi:alpha-L-arabinofuranosidase
MKFQLARQSFLSIGATLVCLLSMAAAGDAQVPYPFELPTKITATLEVETKTSSPINSRLLGLNCNWPEGLYQKTGYNNPVAQELIRTLKPSSLRFPHGVWSNFYDWESDGRRMTDQYVTPYDDSVKNHPDLKYGFEGLHALHQELGFDVVFTYNVNYDSPEKSARRMQDRRDKGFDVKWIELGNEIFWKTQRSEAVSDVEKYIAVSKSHAAALRDVDPNVKISVPVHWRNPTTDAWNMAMKRQDYFDAVTVHKHMGNQEDREGAAQTLGAGSQMVEMAKTIRTVFPGRPLWISEWSVGCGENAISILGMADAYLGFFEHPELFELADYFQINASRALINFDKATRVHTRTSYGAAYEIIRGVFENGERLASKIKSTKIGKGKERIDAVHAAAVLKEGRLIVFAINKSTSRVPLALEIDGNANSQRLVHQALAFDDLNQLKFFAMEESVLTDVNLDNGGIVLPPLSLSRIDVGLNYKK